MVEAYPALVAKTLAKARPYKSEKKADQTSEQKEERRNIVTALQGEACRETYGIKVHLGMDIKEKTLIDDPKADLLDAVLCAAQAAWASRKSKYGVPKNCDRSEGWIVDPATADRARAAG